MRNLDISINNFFTENRNDFLIDIMNYFSTFFNFSDYLFFVIAFTALFIFLKKGSEKTLFFILSISSATLVVLFMKIAFDVDRPENSVVSAIGQSFPSYHATIGTLFFLLLINIFKDSFKGIHSKLFVFLCLLLALTVSFSRIYLGVHWFSDVLFGVILGIFVYFVSLFCYKKLVK